jgi:chemotaxis protein methyltransferase CheR
MDPSEDQNITQIKHHLLRSRGVDLSGYSASFVGRAIRKRLGRSGAGDMLRYVKLLSRSEQETNALLAALSINVTEFFRDKGAFEAFSSKVVRPLLTSKIQVGYSILRVWSAGCASGQEAYTIAICLSEELKQQECQSRPIVSVWGTDISVAAIKKAKEGIYSREEVKGIPERYLKRYFVRQGDSYQVSEELQKIVRFAQDNLLERPKLSCFDAIVCRNVLIYFSRPTHDSVILNLYKALRMDGYLMLGRTEALMGTIRSKFDVIDHENRILRKKE